MATEWYWLDGIERRGPHSPNGLRELARKGTIGESTLIWKEGSSGWVEASRIKGLFQTEDDHRAKSVQGVLVTKIAAQTPAATSSSAHRPAVVASLESILPIDEDTFTKMLRTPMFWWIGLLGITPLLIGTLEGQALQLTAFAMFFAVLWGIVFKSAVFNIKGNWPKLIGAMFFTGLVGIFILGIVYEKLIPASMLELASSKELL